MFIAGDIGGTKTLLALYVRTETGWVNQHEASFSSRQYPDFQSLLQAFMADLDGVPDTLCLGVAGPVIEGRSEVTNLSWTLAENELAEVTGIPRVKLLNDLQAMSLGLLRLPSDRFIELNPEALHRAGNQAVLAAGTGLGESILHWDGERYHALASEGGHTDFAPNDAVESGLLHYLGKRYSHVSYERILSGAGLVNLYEYLKDTDFAPQSLVMKERLAATDDRAREISQAGLEEGDALSREALRLFARIYGAEAGNLALKCFATGGVMLGGGIAPKILPVLTSGAFMESFCAKGRFADFMRSIPVRVALDSSTGLLGAASWAELHSP